MSDDIIGSFVLRGTKYSSLIVYVPYEPTIPLMINIYFLEDVRI